MNKPQRPSLSR